MLKATRAAAYHEAGHAVMRLYVGAPPTLTEVSGREGVSHGTGGSLAIWDLLLVALAGPYAEARISRKAAVLIFLAGGGAADFRCAKELSELLPPGAADLAYREVPAVLRAQWASVERVAAALLMDGRIEADRVSVVARVSLRGAR